MEALGLFVVVFLIVLFCILAALGEELSRVFTFEQVLAVDLIASAIAVGIYFLIR